ncbi:MAG TPA: nuclease-related domain-containing protein [Verrucomicrobiae bacterium]|nr:nuclease-related domain-containing protein [Verrucomicrobiae bacterium]
MLIKAFFIFLFALPVVLAIVFMVWHVIHMRRQTRWPISQKLLRPPGESLRRRLEEMDERWIFYWLGMILAWMTYLLVMFTLLKAVAPNSAALFFTIIGVGVAVAAACAWWVKNVITKRADYALGFYGERVVGEELNQLMREGCHVFHDFPADPKWNIDHIVVAPSGVYVVETKTRRKRRAQKGKPDHVITFDGDTLTFPHNEQSRYGLDQARENAKWLSGFLSSSTGEKVWVDPILTFPGWMINRSTDNASVQVLNPKEIGKVVLSRPARLTAQSIKQIVHQLDHKCRDVEF